VVWWFKRRTPISDPLWQRAVQAHPVLNGLTAEEQTRLREIAGEFGQSMQFRWAGGLEAREDVAASASLLACLPVLEIGLKWYRRWRTVLIVPRHYKTPSIEVDEAGVVHESVVDAAGEFAEIGTVVLSLRDIRSSGTGSGYNVIVHEAAHVLDAADGALNGIPPLHKGMDASRWTAVFSSAYEDLQRRIIGPARARANKRSVFDPQAAEAPEEFFAVASELFFELPRRLHAEYPEVYDELAAFYRQDRRPDKT